MIEIKPRDSKMADCLTLNIAIEYHTDSKKNVYCICIVNVFSTLVNHIDFIYFSILDKDSQKQSDEIRGKASASAEIKPVR